MDERDIVEQLQDACDLARDKRELERLCGEAKIEIKGLRTMYDGQCRLTDEWHEKYRAELERKADATLLARIADLEDSLRIVNARLTAVQAEAMTANLNSTTDPVG